MEEGLDSPARGPRADAGEALDSNLSPLLPSRAGVGRVPPDFAAPDAAPRGRLMIEHPTSFSG